MIAKDRTERIPSVNTVCSPHSRSCLPASADWPQSIAVQSNFQPSGWLGRCKYLKTSLRAKRSNPWRRPVTGSAKQSTAVIPGRCERVRANGSRGRAPDDRRRAARWQGPHRT